MMMFLGVATAWYEWYPGPTVHFAGPGLDVRAGDTLRARVSAHNATAGTVALANLATGASVSVPLSSPSEDAALCLQDAEWVVEAFEGGGAAALADFGAVVFGGATATTGDGEEVGPAEGDVYEIGRGGDGDGTVTAVGLGSSNVTISYVLDGGGSR